MLGLQLVVAILFLAVIGRSQTLAPSFTADRVLPSDSATPSPLAPGMLVSIYGQHLGPEQGCEGRPDPAKREIPTQRTEPHRWTGFLIYPNELCGVQVFVGAEAAELLYAQDRQINFKVPHNVPLQGLVEVKVVFSGRSSSPVRVRAGVDQPKISVHGIARVRGPVWIRVALPYGWGKVVYPAGLPPLDFGCNQVEVRRGGSKLQRIDIVSRMVPGGIAGPGNGCGSDLTRPGNSRAHEGRLPLHLQYRFDVAGTYEVRYTRLRNMFDAEVLLQSAWTPIVVQPEKAASGESTPPAENPPQDPAEIISDFLPSLLSSLDSTSLASVLEFLYHRDEKVRRYAASALAYWPQDEIDRRLAESIRKRGPSDAVASRFSARPAPDLIVPMLPYLQSDNLVLLRGAIDGLGWMLRFHRKLIPGDVTARAESAILAAVDHVCQVGDAQTIANLTLTLGALGDDQAHGVLWSLVDRGIARGQAPIVIAWRKDLRDLPRLEALLTASSKADSLDAELSSVPYAMRNSFGEAAIPFLERMIQRSGYVWVRTACARELVLAGRPAGFKFVAEAIELNKLYKQEMRQFVLDRFPQMRGADDQALVAFLKQRAE